MKTAFPCALAALALALAPVAAQAQDPTGRPAAPGPLPEVTVPPAYFSGSVVCLNAVTRASCQLLLEPDGRYIVAINRGPQAEMPSIDGPWQIEARSGRYRLRAMGGQTQLCLQPDGRSGGYASERASELFAGAGCYPFALHASGESWTQADSLGRTNQMWLVGAR